jgi:hypothetical protein
MPTDFDADAQALADAIDRIAEDRAAAAAVVAAERSAAERALSGLAGLLDAAVASQDVDRIAYVGVAAAALKAEADAILYDARRKARPYTPGGRYIVEGVTVVEKDYGKDRTGWENRLLLDSVLPRIVWTARATALVDRVADLRPPAAGRDDDEALARALVPLLLEVLAPGWKVGTHGKQPKIDPATGEVLEPGEPASGLRSYGIDPADFCREQSRATVTFR